MWTLSDHTLGAHARRPPSRGTTDRRCTRFRNELALLVKIQEKKARLGFCVSCVVVSRHSDCWKLSFGSAVIENATLLYFDSVYIKFLVCQIIDFDVFDALDCLE